MVGVTLGAGVEVFVFAGCEVRGEAVGLVEADLHFKIILNIIID